MKIEVHSHPQLCLRCFVVEYSGPVENLTTPSTVLDLFSPGAEAPFESSDAIRKMTRDMLRVGGFKPTGRSKPAAEYLIKAVEKGILSPINVPVDVCNAVSLHSGIPISVVDCDLLSESPTESLTQPLRVMAAEKGTRYVFNASGQEMDIGGLLCLWDAQGPCANAVKDSQRTKTNPQTKRVLTLMWGTRDLSDRVRQVESWCRSLLEPFGAVSDVEL